MSYLGLVIPTPAVTLAVLSWWDQQKVKKLVPEFPELFDRARDDWAKFKVGMSRGLFRPEQQRETLAWFRDFPQLWETVRPNFIKTDAGREWGGQVDNFIGSMKRTPFFRSSQLGLAPVLIAGVLLVGGAAAGLWAIAYIEKQNNISKMIDQVVTGALPPAVLTEAIKAEKTGGLFAGLANVGQVAAFGVAAWLAVKLLKLGKR